MGYQVEAQTDSSAGMESYVGDNTLQCPTRYGIRVPVLKTLSPRPEIRGLQMSIIKQDLILQILLEPLGLCRQLEGGENKSLT